MLKAPFQSMDELMQWANERGMDVEEDNYGQLVIHTGLVCTSSHGDLAPFIPEEEDN